NQNAQHRPSVTFAGMPVTLPESAVTFTGIRTCRKESRNAFDRRLIGQISVQVFFGRNCRRNMFFQLQVAR
ncbi:hypothetical protein, partial [Polaromonas sp.]|uniref:hypothetical protein n=1 Tax=Polaromonas sp. TaxID=1869339 RepID=UPI0025D57F0E